MTKGLSAQRWSFFETGILAPSAWTRFPADSDQFQNTDRFSQFEGEILNTWTVKPGTSPYKIRVDRTAIKSPRTDCTSGLSQSDVTISLAYQENLDENFDQKPECYFGQ